MQEYLIPANSKRSKLIFGLFRPVDLIIASIGAALTFLGLVIFQPNNLAMSAIVLTPLCVCSFLVVPVANYHNILCVLQNIFRFYFNDVNEYVWKGWDVKNEFK